MLIKNNRLRFILPLFKFESLLGSKIEGINLRWAKRSIDRVRSYLDEPNTRVEPDFAGDGNLEKLFGIKEVLTIEI